MVGTGPFDFLALHQEVEMLRDTSLRALERILHQPRVGSLCGLCGGSLGLYIVCGDRHLLCAPCTRDRIDACTVDSAKRPSWVGVLHEEVLHEIRCQEHREQKRYSVSWDLARCSNCGQFMNVDDARYPPTRPGQARPASTLVPARRLRDGTLIVYHPTVVEIVRPICLGCYDDSRR